MPGGPSTRSTAPHEAERVTRGLKHHYRGKVRDLYEVGHDRILMVASDRISVFDVVLPDEIPDKGRALTALSSFWFEQTAHLWPNHVVSADPTDFPETVGAQVAGRAMLVRAAQPVRLECIARGYLFGSAWSEYQERGTVSGVALPSGLRLAEQLPAPIFTSTTKAEVGHDETLTDAQAAEAVGDETFEACRDATLAIYGFAVQHAARRGLLLADTKLEFGRVGDELLVIDEMLTSDSSRYWDAEHYEVGISPPSFDKQPVRDHYLGIGWDRTPPAPPAPAEVIEGTRARYVEAYETLTGRSFDEWHGADT
jgi:phosphoribosylaminoimidazole-succinocarboxamide synthase